MSGLGHFVSSGSASNWTDEVQAARHEQLTAADYNRTKAGLGSYSEADGAASCSLCVVGSYQARPASGARMQCSQHQTCT